MVRKMAYIGTSYLAGLFFASFLNFKFDFIFAFGITIVAVVFIVFSERKNISASVCMIIAAIAMIVYGSYESAVYYPILKYDGQTVNASGKIININYSSNDKASYIIKGEIEDKSSYFLLYCDALECDYFDEITITGTMNKFENSYTFPAESYYKSQSIFLQMTKPTEYSIKSDFSIFREIIHYRDYLYDKIITYLPNEEGTALVAMLCGDKTGLDNDTKTLLFRSGIGHIMSVSGVHLAIVASVIMWMIKGFGLNKWIRIGILEILLLGFIVFAGFSVSVVRSAVMLTIVYGAELFKRRSDNFNSLGISIILITALEPFMVQNASFMLSAAGVMGIGVFAPAITSSIKIDGIRGKIIKNFIAMLCVLVTVFPVSFLFFDEISIISPITNVILVPFCTIALVCGIIIAFTGGVSVIAFPLLMLAGLCCKLVLNVSKFIGNLSFVYIPTGFDFLKIVITISIFSTILCFIIFKNRKCFVFTIAGCVISLLFCEISYEIINTDILSIALIGDESSSSLIVYMGDDACIIDLNGGRKLAVVNQKYLRRAGIKNICALALNSNIQQSVSAYEKRFQLFDVLQVLIPNEESYLTNMKILGVTPTKINESETEIDMGNYQIFMSDENTVKIVYGEFSLLCVSGKTTIDHSEETYIVAAVYEGDMIPVNYGYSISMDEEQKISNTITGSALITCKQDGKTKIRRITNGSRQ